MAISYELNLDQTMIDRQAYGVLDWLSDIGGIFEAFYFFGVGFIAVMQFGQYKAMMVK